jgi:starch synthase
VVFGLSRELAIRGNHVEIILPKYDNLRYDHIHELNPVYNDLWVPWYDGAVHCTVYFGFVHDRKCFFIEPHSQDNFFNRGSVYGFPDDVLRYAFFSRAAMEFMLKSGKHPDIIHCHDWQTALAPVLLYEIYQHLGMHQRGCASPSTTSSTRGSPGWRCCAPRGCTSRSASSTTTACATTTTRTR